MWVVPGAKEVTHPRLELSSPSGCAPVRLRSARNWVRCELANSLANAVGGPPASVAGSRWPAISSALVASYAAVTWAAENGPVFLAGGTTIPLAPSANFAAREPANGLAGSKPAAAVIVMLGEALGALLRPVVAWPVAGLGVGCAGAFA